MNREISVRELRDHTSEVVAALHSGQRLSLVVDGAPVADIVPHPTRSPWVASTALRKIVEEAGADAELPDDVAEVRASPIDDH